MVAQSCNPSNWEMEARGAGIQGHPHLQIELEVSLTNLRPAQPGIHEILQKKAGDGRENRRKARKKD